MARKKKPKPAAKASFLRRWWRGVPAEHRGCAAAVAAKAGAALAAAALVVAGAKALESAVHDALPDREPAVAYVHLRPVPPWMPRRLARRIARSLGPPGLRFGDERLTQAAFRLAERSPWIRQVRRVQKRRGPEPNTGVLEVRAAFRRPFAKVHRRDLAGYVVVDAEGTVLPDSPADPQVPRWRAAVRGHGGSEKTLAYYAAEHHAPAELRPLLQPVHYIIIQGVRSDPPAPGRRWDAADLADGLRLVRLLRARPYGDQVTLVDVANHDGREPYGPRLRLFAQVGRGRTTEIRFGRFPMPGGLDYAIDPNTKLARLDAWVREHGGRLAGTRRWIDLRYDELHVSPD
jgi:hypothetical protein